MATIRQLINLVLDEVKQNTDDNFFTPEHAVFLLGKARNLLLKQQYKNMKEQMMESNFQTICLDLEQTPAYCNEWCEGGFYLKSTEKVPFLLPIYSPRIYGEDYFQGVINMVGRDRFRFVGNNKLLGNMVYATIGPDSYLYLRSSNPQYKYLEKVRITGVFEDFEKAAELSCCPEENCDPWDTSFPLEDAYISTMVEMVVKELRLAIAEEEDKDNNANDESSEKADEVGSTSKKKTTDAATKAAIIKAVLK